MMSSTAVSPSWIRRACPLMPTQCSGSAMSYTAIEIRGSRSRLRGQCRSVRLLIRRPSPSRTYQATAWWGNPSASSVASVANRAGSRKARAASGIGDGALAGALVRGSGIARWYARVRRTAAQWPASVGGRAPGDRSAGAGDRGAAGAGDGAANSQRAGGARHRGRSAQQVPLPVLDAEGGEHVAVAPVLDPLGDETSADPAAERHERLDQGLLRVALLAANRMDDLAVDLDDRRPERGDEGEARVAGPGIVDREAEAQAAQLLDPPDELLRVRDRLLLGAFDRQLAWRQAGVARGRGKE